MAGARHRVTESLCDGARRRSKALGPATTRPIIAGPQGRRPACQPSRSSPRTDPQGRSPRLARIRERGLQPTDVGIVPGAAGGPKALGIQGLDLAIFGEWLPRAPRERSLIGASIGSWRFASACLPDAVAGLTRLGELYTRQRFPKGVSIAEVSRKCAAMLDDLLAGQDARILDNPLYRLNVVVVKSHGRLAHDHKASLGLGLSSVIRDNLIGRRHRTATSNG